MATAAQRAEWQRTSVIAWVTASVFSGKKYQLSDFDPFSKKQLPKATVEDLRRIFVR